MPEANDPALARHPDNGIPAFDSPYWRDASLGTPDAAAPPAPPAPSASDRAPGRGPAVLGAALLLVAGGGVVLGARSLGSSSEAATGGSAGAQAQRVSTITVGLRSWPVDAPTCTVVDGRVTFSGAVGTTEAAGASDGRGAGTLAVTVGGRRWQTVPGAGATSVSLDGGRVLASGDAVLVTTEQGEAPERVPVHVDFACGPTVRRPGA